MRNSVQLITYVDRFGGGDLIDFKTLLHGPLAGVFGGVHLLPFYYPIDGADAGFDPIDHTQVDPRLGTWKEVHALRQEVEVMADLIVNHISADSPQFQDFSRGGSTSRFSGMFLTLDRVFPEGATEGKLLQIYRPRPGLPLSYATLKNGEKRILWTTFTPQQIDIDVHHPEGDAYLKSILKKFQQSGVTIIRLDAAGYAIKKSGTNCFMIPQTYEFISELSTYAKSLGIEVLVEIHSYYKTQIEIAKRVDRVYDFALPPLILHTLFQRNARALKAWLLISPRNAITVLDTHDGIGVIDVGPDPSHLEGGSGLLAPAEINALVESIHQNTAGQSKQATGAAASNLDLYQVNSTYYDALARNDRDYLWSRAMQFFAPGIPQVYYVGLLAGANDIELLAKSKVGRDINRHHYPLEEVLADLQKPVVKELLQLIRFRNEHPAFDGQFSLLETPDHVLSVEWKLREHWTKLDLDFRLSSCVITYSQLSGTGHFSVGAGLSKSVPIGQTV